MWELIREILAEIYHILLESGWYMLGGFALAGLIHAFVNPKRVRRWLGRDTPGAVAKAAVVGVPLPLCSCSVIPVATGLSRDGASDGAVASFLISTPESGADSVAVSWALLDPILTVARVVAAFFTAMAGGLAVIAAGAWGVAKPEKSAATKSAEPAGDCCARETSSPAPAPTSGCCGDAEAKSVEAQAANESRSDCCSSETAEPPQISDANESTGSGESCCSNDTRPEPAGLWPRIAQSQRYAFAQLLPDIALWFVVGLLATGVIAALVPADFLERFSGFTGMLIVMLAGVPIYVCATASTPMAAMLIMKGMSPGTALVFLLAGPATNLATIGVVRGLIGWRGLVAYLLAIAGGALVFGLGVDAIYSGWNITPTMGMQGEHAAHAHNGFQHAGALILLFTLTLATAQDINKRLRRRKAG